MKFLADNKFSVILAVYIGIRAPSFFLIDHTRLATTVTALLITAFTYVCIKNIQLAWKVLVLELLLDGAGHFFELHGLILRTWLLGIFGVTWLVHKIRAHSAIVWPQKNVVVALSAFGVVLIWAVVNGLLNHHAKIFVVQDTILYLFIALLFPALEFERGWTSLHTAAARAFIFGTALFSAITFALYSSGRAVLQDQYYHWFRDVAAGKITDLGSHFFRIVTAEQILFVPIVLLLLAGLIKNSRDKKLWGLLIASLFVLVLNFTRIYFLALGVGAFILLYHAPKKQWLKIMAAAGALTALIFFTTHLVASRGNSLGLELVGVRVGQAVAPTDQSAAIRMALLPDIMRHIKVRPLLGSGLGTEVTYLDPQTHEPHTRTQFDWGYFEMITELGAIGTIIYLTLLIVITKSCGQRELIAGAAALFVINITTPALFQGFGVLYFAYLAAYKNRAP